MNGYFSIRWRRLKEKFLQHIKEVCRWIFFEHVIKYSTRYVLEGENNFLLSEMSLFLILEWTMSVLRCDITEKMNLITFLGKN